MRDTMCDIKCQQAHCCLYMDVSQLTVSIAGYN